MKLGSLVILYKVFFCLIQNEKRLAFQELKKVATANSSLFDWASFSDKDMIRQNKFYYSYGSKLTTEQLEQVLISFIELRIIMVTAQAKLLKAKWSMLPCLLFFNQI